MSNKRKIIIWLIAIILVVNLFYIAEKAVAMLVEDIPLTTVETTKGVEQKLKWYQEAWNFIRDKVILRAGKIAYKNALRNFLSRIAYDTATEIATGGTAKTPLFDTRFIGDFANDVMETTLVDTLDVLTSSCKNGLPDIEDTILDESETGTCKRKKTSKNAAIFPKDDPNTKNIDESTTDPNCTPTCLASYVAFNICEPSNLDFSVALNATLFNDFSGQGGHRPKCSFNQLQEKWADWNISLSSDIDRYSQMKAVDILRSAFSPQETDIGLYLSMQGEMRNAIKKKEWLETMDRWGRDAFKPVTEPITKAIKTPASLVKGQTTQSLVANQPVYEQTPTTDIVADAVGIFTNTLASKLMKRLLTKGLTTGQQAQTTQVYNWVSQQAAALTLQNQFADLKPVTLQPPGGPQRILEDLTSCPYPDKPGPLECVIPPQLTYAIEQKMTVKQAIDQGYLDGTKPVGWEAPNQQTGSFEQPNYLSGYPFRSLVILRTHRIIPVGWELAAWYARLINESHNLNYFIQCFEDPAHPDDPAYPESCQGDLSYNPYYHLVDPNWVLKSPELLCAKKGAGYEIVAEDWICTENNVTGTVLPSGGGTDTYPYCEDDVTYPDLPVRQVLRNDEYCADWQSCLKENDDGSCAGEGYGYCLKEKEIWRLNGESCPSQYASCETLTRKSDSQQFSFLTSTLLPCAENDAGCSWYALEQERTEPPTSTLEWQTNLSDPRVYLNDSALTCELDDIGCTKVARMIPVTSGGNYVFNGGFESASTTNSAVPTDWIFEAYVPGGATVVQEVVTDEQYQGSQSLHMSATLSQGGGGPLARSESYIPIDARFVYQLSFLAKGESSNVRARVQLHFYNENKTPIDSPNYIFNNFLNTNWQAYLGTYGQSNSGANYLIPSDAKYVRVFIQAPTGADSSGSAWFDAVNLAIKESPVVVHNLENFSYATTSENAEYSSDENQDIVKHLKVAPAYLHCEDYNTILFGYGDEDADVNECFSDGYYFRDDIEHCVLGGDALCQEYATYCTAEEIGCQGYMPQNGDPEVPAKTVLEDTCPEECAGYDNYIELTNFFETVECPMYESQAQCFSKGCSWNASAAVHCYAEDQQQLFIPETAQTCSSNEAGCEEFTNLDELSQGGEGLEYFTELRQCVSPDNPDIGYYYTWEGSDTTGYQLKKWEFLKSNIEDFTIPGNASEEGSGPCTNINVGEEECTDTYNPSSYSTNIHFCTPATLAGGNYNCRDFFDSLGHHFYRLQNYAVTASSECHPYRRTLTGQIYNADPSEASSCSSSANGCKGYKGNSGNNVANVLSESFEESPEDWNWMDSLGDIMNGMEQSTESVVQSEHSLLVHLTNDTLSYPATSLVNDNKRYTLSFWAKKAPLSSGKTMPGSGGGVNYWTQQGQGQGGAFNTLRRLVKWLGKPVLAQTQPPLNFSTSITNEWNDYELGPIEIEEITGDEVQLNIEIDGLSSTEGFYIDNIILKEYTDNFYVIKNSWQTPVACDNNLDNSSGLATCSGAGGSACVLVDQTGASFTCNILAGENSCQVAGFRANLGAQQGCLEYQDRNKDTHYLKSFDYICSDTAIGCEAFVNTQNSTYYQSEHTYKENEFECNNTVGVITQGVCANPLNPASQGSYCCAIRGQNICRTDAPNGSCAYSGQVVPNDEIVYLVYDPEKTCANQGCMSLGQPELNKQKDFTDTGYVQSVQTVNLINNPDDYDNSLCGPSAEFCETYTSSNSSAKFYYYDPIGAPTSSFATSLTCYYDTAQNKWFKSGVTNADCPGSYSLITEGAGYLPYYSDYDYQNWAGLCGDNDATCAEYRDPEDPKYDNVAECDSAIKPQLWDVCPGETGTLTADYCLMTINGLEHKVCDIAGDDATCQEEPAGSDNWRYTANDWICDLGDLAGAGGEDCCLGGSTPACNGEANEVKVCLVQPNQSRCYYSPVCQPYYYKSSSVDTTGCNGVVEREKGCRLFNDTDNTALSYSSDASPDYNAPAACIAGQAFTGSTDCDANLLLEVQKDRECQEWLECGSSYQASASESYCLDLIRCAGVSPDSPSNCTNIIASPATALTIDLTNSTTRLDAFDSIRFLSGFSHAGAKWSSDKIIPGYYSPENMAQAGAMVDIKNGDFEYTSTGLSKVADYWSFCYSDNNCAWNQNAWWGTNGCNFSLDTQNPYSGQYSLKIDKTNPSNQCPYLNADILPDISCADPPCPPPYENSTNSDNNFYPISSGQQYNLSFYARSENSAQKVSVGFEFYTEDSPTATTSAWSTATIEPGTAWERYAIIFGNTLTDPNTTDNIYYRVIPEAASYYRIVIDRPNVPSTGNLDSIWLDNFTLEPMLNIGDSAQLAKDCRLFPKNDSPACAYQENHQYIGWNGYCLEPDPFASYNPYPLNPQNTQQCLQWYPVDTLSGDPLSVFNVEELVSYDDTKPLYYCAQSAGNYILGKTTSGVGIYTSDYKTQSHINDVNDRITDGCGGGSFSSNDNFSLCLIDDCSAGGCDWGDNKHVYCWWRDTNDPVTGGAAVNCTNGGPNVWGHTYALPEPDLQINLNNIIHSIDMNTIGMYLDVLDTGGGWSNTSNFMQKTNPQPTNLEVGVTQYENLISSGSEGCNFHAWFDDDSRDLRGIRIYCDDSTEEGHGRYNIYYYMSEPCTAIVKVVDIYSNQRVWYNRYNSGWQDSTNVLKYNKNIIQFPYGSIIATDDNPLGWPLVLVTNSGYSLPGYGYAGLPYSTENIMGDILSVSPGRRCTAGDASTFGQFCSTAEDCGGGGTGVCSGIGKYCFGNDGYMTSEAKACTQSTDCGLYETCKAVGYTSSNANSTANLHVDDIAAAIDRIQNLFANVYNVWTWDDATGHYVDADTSGIDLDKSNDFGQAPIVTNIEINGQTNGIVNLPLPGASINLDFNTDVDSNQLPLVKIYIKWHNTYPHTQEIDYGGMDKPSENDPHRVSYTYTCVPNASGTACMSCGEGGTKVGDHCEWPRPKINIKDHWNWCKEGWAGAGENVVCNSDMGLPYGNSTDKIIVGP